MQDGSQLSGVESENAAKPRVASPNKHFGVVGSCNWLYSGFQSERIVRFDLVNDGEGPFLEVFAISVSHGISPG
jgi:hypothetical protein